MAFGTHGCSRCHPLSGASPLPSSFSVSLQMCSRLGGGRRSQTGAGGGQGACVAVPSEGVSALHSPSPAGGVPPGAELMPSACAGTPGVTAPVCSLACRPHPRAIPVSVLIQERLPVRSSISRGLPSQVLIVRRLGLQSPESGISFLALRALHPLPHPRGIPAQLHPPPTQSRGALRAPQAKLVWQ